MSVPLDRLYNFLHSLVDHDITIYRFWPHGSKKLKDCVPLTDLPHDLFLQSYLKSIPVICHDQEPLNIEELVTSVPKTLTPITPPSIFRGPVSPLFNVYDKNLLCHSERNSEQLSKFENSGSIGVYYWCHAIIARDWFRYAEVDPLLTQRKVSRDFLIYNRAWTGTREYRLQFAELIVNHQLDQFCRMGFNPNDGDTNYCDYTVKNPSFQIRRYDLEKYFSNNTTTSAASADYVNVDYQETELEVVLETLFDDSRWQLTEKILRPIACGHPFILASTAGSLAYLRSYGFQTFENYIDESYDLESDPVKRLNMIISLLKQITQMPSDKKLELFNNMRKVAAFNRTRFFSDEFFNDVVNEYKHNIDAAVTKIKQYCTGSVIKYIFGSVNNPLTIFNFQYFVDHGASQQDIDQLLEWVDQQNSLQS
jgi:hypothetical protein